MAREVNLGGYVERSKQKEELRSNCSECSCCATNRYALFGRWYVAFPVKTLRIRHLERGADQYPRLYVYLGRKVLLSTYCSAYMWLFCLGAPREYTARR